MKIANTRIGYLKIEFEPTGPQQHSGNRWSLITNLTGHPAVGMPCGFINNLPQAIMFTGGVYDEAAPPARRPRLRASDQVAHDASES